ncbi:MAG: HNH endonuclease, partial [Actinomycetota bacterium]|nr:HNH endonuclease [Actinomycetota bacterium]
RDQGCAMPGCHTPPAWTDAHHIQHWANGGPTALHNLVLLCGQHHTAIHHQGWTVHIDPTDRLPTFHAPPQLDPNQHPRRHHRHALTQLAGPDPPGG